MHNPYYDIEEVFATVGGILGATWFISLVFQIVCYVFTAVALYSIAKRRGIHAPGLAWVPVANLWVLGSISDQYKYVTAGKVQKRRGVLLGLSISSGLMGIISIVYMIAQVVNIAVSKGEPAPSEILGLIGGFLLIWLVVLVLLIVYAVFYFICLYNVYVSCMPNSATVFLVLSIFFSVTTPFFLFACRNKDEGMPPRYGGAGQIPTGYGYHAQAPYNPPVDPPVQDWNN